MNNLTFFSMFGGMGPLVYLLALLDLILKGITLFKSAQRSQKVWFVALLLINSLGLLPIVYLLVNNDVQLKQMYSVFPKTAKKSGRKTRK